MAFTLQRTLTVRTSSEHAAGERAAGCLKDLADIEALGADDLPG